MADTPERTVWPLHRNPCSSQKGFFNFLLAPVPEVYDWMTNPKYGLVDHICYIVMLFCCAEGFALLCESGHSDAAFLAGAGLYVAFACVIRFRDRVLYPWAKKWTEEQ